MKKYLLLLITIPFLMGMTQQEAQQMYSDLECVATPSQIEGECVKVFCPIVQEMVSKYVKEWDSEPIPDPEPEPSCIATWCGLPVQDCSFPQLEGGIDSCGNTCSKPSVEWPNCMQDGVMVEKEF